MKNSLMFLIFLLAFSCRAINDDCDPNYYCNTFAYQYGWLNVELTNPNNTPTLIRLYAGYVEDNELLTELYTIENSYSFYLTVGNRYSVEVYYQNGSQTTIALDGGRLRQESRTNCGETCYEEPSLNLNLSKL